MQINFCLHVAHGSSRDGCHLLFCRCTAKGVLQGKNGFCMGNKGCYRGEGACYRYEDACCIGLQI